MYRKMIGWSREGNKRRGKGREMGEWENRKVGTGEKVGRQNGRKGRGWVSNGDKKREIKGMGKWERIKVSIGKEKVGRLIGRSGRGWVGKEDKKDS